jgi:hypothetical protein
MLPPNVENGPRRFVLGTDLATRIPSPRPSFDGGKAVGGSFSFVRQIWCRDARQGQSMDTQKKLLQGKSGKRNLAYYIL